MQLPECIQKSLTSAPDEKAKIFRIYDVMGASATAPQRCQLSKSNSHTNYSCFSTQVFYLQTFPNKQKKGGEGGGTSL